MPGLHPHILGPAPGHPSHVGVWPDPLPALPDHHVSVLPTHTRKHTSVLPPPPTHTHHTHMHTLQVSGLPPSQLYLITVMEDSGRDLEKTHLEGWEQARCLLMQVGGRGADAGEGGGGGG